MGTTNIPEKNMRLAELILKAKGDRSIRKYAKAADVNPSIVSRIITGDYKPGVKVLERLASAAEQGVTLQELLEAAGYSKAVESAFPETGMEISHLSGAAKATIAAASLFAGPLGIPVAAIIAMSSLIKTSHHSATAGENDTSKELPSPQRKYVMKSFSIITDLLSTRGIRYQVEAWNASEECVADKVISFEDQAINEWWFHFSAIGPHAECPSVSITHKQYLLAVLAMYLDNEADPMRKISLVIDDEEAFDLYKQMKGKTSFRGNFSVILVDTENLTILGETYISSFNEKTRELLLLT